MTGDQTMTLQERARRSEAAGLELTPAEERARKTTEASMARISQRGAEEGARRDAAMAEHDARVQRAREILHTASWKLDETRQDEIRTRLALTAFEREHEMRLDAAHAGLERSLTSAEHAFRERVVNVRRDLVLAQKAGTGGIDLSALAALYVAARMPEFGEAVRALLADPPAGHEPLSEITDDVFVATRQPLKGAHDDAKARVSEAQGVKDAASQNLNRILNP